MVEPVKRTILTRHNSQRNVLALGGADDFVRPQAADMATMVDNKYPHRLLPCQIESFIYINFMRSNGMTNWN